MHGAQADVPILQEFFDVPTYGGLALTEEDGYLCPCKRDSAGYEMQFQPDKRDKGPSALFRDCLRCYVLRDLQEES